MNPLKAFIWSFVCWCLLSTRATAVNLQDGGFELPIEESPWTFTAHESFDTAGLHNGGIRYMQPVAEGSQAAYLIGGAFQVDYGYVAIYQDVAGFIVG